MKRILATTLAKIATTSFALLTAGGAQADTVVQIPLPDLLDGRSVTTLTGGNIVTWTLPTDGGGLQNAYATQAVALLQGAPAENSLPDNGTFPGDARHPEVVLNFSNAADALSPQTYLVLPSTGFTFAVPEATYSKFFLFFNGAAGGATITVTLNYVDGTQTENAAVPDYYADISPTDPVIFNLATNLAKWDATNQINEANHHNITGVELNPLADKTLTEIQVDRGAEGTLLFWGATGIATSDIVGAGGGGSAGAGGTAGGAGAAGLGGGAGTGGLAGAGGVAALGGSAGLAAGTAGSTAAGTGGTSNASAGGVAGSVGTAGGAGSSNAATPTISNDSGSGCQLSALHSSSAQTLWLILAVVSSARLRRRRAAH